MIEKTISTGNFPAENEQEQWWKGAGMFSGPIDCSEFFCRIVNDHDGRVRMEMKRNILALAAALTLTAGMKPVRANVVYDTTQNPTDAIDQQNGNNDYYIGDTATVASTGKLTTIAIVFK